MVLPVPGGPQNTSEPSERVASMRVSAPSGPSRWSCPTTSSSFCGRSRSASGRGASLSRPAAANRRRAGALARGRHPLNTAEICCPPRRMMMRQERLGYSVMRARSCVLLDALAVDRHDDVAALEAEIAGIGAVVDVEDDDAVVGILELQFVGQRRRQVGDLGAGERRTRADGDLVARRLRRGLQRHRHVQLAAAAQHGRASRCRRAAWWRSGSRRRWGRRPPARRPTRSRRRA